MEKIDIECIWGPMVRAVLDKRMPANRPNIGRSNFFDHFEFKIQNKLLLTKIGMFGIGCWATAISKIFVYKIAREIQYLNWAKFRLSGLFWYYTNLFQP